MPLGPARIPVARNPRMGGVFTALQRAGSRAVVSRRRVESGLISSRDPASTDVAEVSIPPREAEMAAALAAAGGGFTEAIISGTSSVAATI